MKVLDSRSMLICSLMLHRVHEFSVKCLGFKNLFTRFIDTYEKDTIKINFDCFTQGSLDKNLVAKKLISFFFKPVSQSIG